MFAAVVGQGAKSRERLPRHARSQRKKPTAHLQFTLTRHDRLSLAGERADACARARSLTNGAAGAQLVPRDEGACQPLHHTREAAETGGLVHLDANSNASCFHDNQCW